MRALVLFCTKFNSEQLLFEAFYRVMVFLAALSLKLNVFFHFCTISYLNHINLPSPLTPLCGEIDIYSWGLFSYEIQFRTTFI